VHAPAKLLLLLLLLSHSPFLKKRKEGVDLILNSLKSRLQPMFALPSSFRNTALS
jgi:hypothetical protein